MKISKTKQYFIVGFILFGGAIVYMNLSVFIGDSSVNKESFVVFSNVAHNDITQNSVTLVAKTSVPVICQVEYAEYQQETMFASDMNVYDYPHTEHEIILSNLNPDTRYNYQFQAVSDDRKFYSDIRTFTTIS